VVIIIITISLTINNTHSDSHTLLI